MTTQTASTEIEVRRPTYKALCDALEWALAELDGRTKYEAFEQRANCLKAATDTLAAAHPTPRPRKITGRSALRVGNVDGKEF